MVAHGGGVFGELVVYDVLGGGVSGGAGQGVAAEGGAVVARLEGAGVVFRHEGADGDAAAQSLGEGHDVGFYAELLVSEEGAEPAEAGLHFVEYEEEAFLVAEFADVFEVSVGGDVDATFGLDGFEHDGYGVVGDGAFEFFDVAEGYVLVSGRDGLEEFLVVGLSGGGDVGHGATVEGVEGGDYLEGAVAVPGAVAAGELHRAFVGLGAAVAEEHFVEGGVLHQYLGQLKLGYGVELVGGLEQGAGLFGDGVGYGFVGVAGVVDGPAGGEVEVFLAVDVPDLGSVALDDDDGLAADHEHIVFALYVFPIGGHAVPPVFSFPLFLSFGWGVERWRWRSLVGLVA